MQDTVVKCIGLVSQYNPLSIQSGALVRADNAVIRRENIVENRRGYALYFALSAAAKQLFVYSNKVLAHQGTTITYDNGGSGSDYSGSYTEPTSSRIRTVEANSNLYFTTSSGVKVFTDAAGTAARSAGAPRSLDPSYALNAAGTGFLTTLYYCAYRALIKRVDANRNYLFGYPSPRLVVYNSAVTSKNVDLTLYLPAEAIAGDYVQFYRSAQGSTAAAAADEMKLVYEVKLTSSNISAGYITFTDVMIDALRDLNAALYTNPSQEGILQGNDRPPLCKDMALYKSQYLFFGNTSTKQRLYIDLIGHSSLNGKSIVLAGTTYTFSTASENTATGQVLVSTSGTDADRIEATARSLVKVINRYSSNTSVYAYYTSGSDDLPGKLLIEERGVGAAAFTIIASDSAIAAMFSPGLPVTPSTSTECTSSNDQRPNYIFYSKAQQPEHVPALNYLPVGPSNANILRLAALRDSLIIITDRGVYRLTGETPESFNVTPLDLTVYCVAADSVAVLANAVYMLSNQGVVRVTDTGVEVVSRDIEQKILPLLTYTSLSTYTAGAAYESERTYLLSTMTESTDTTATQTFVYNIFTKAWTRWTFGFTAAVVEPSTDKLFFVKPGDVNLYRERKTFTDNDYSDPEYSITIVSISGSDVEFTLSSGTPEEGWSISQGGTQIVIDSLTVGATSYTATMASEPPASWAAGAATLYPGVDMDIEWVSWTGGQPGLLKQVREAQILTDNIPGTTSPTSLIATFKSNFDEAQEEVSIDSGGSAWGTGSWGSFSWGGGGDPYAYRACVPDTKQYCARFSLGVRFNNANEHVPVGGYSITFEMVGSERAAP